jgi:predicted DNA-binding transcriptional regulator YafY
VSMATAEDVTALVEAIQNCRRVRLVYRRQLDGVTSMHEVAPLDLRPGDTGRTATTIYLWAWCFAEQEAEMHLLDRVLRAQALEARFDPTEIAGAWPMKRWPIPAEWTVPRDWSLL